MMKKIYSLVVSALLIAVLGGCANTLEGMGEDIEKMGKSIKDAVNK